MKQFPLNSLIANHLKSHRRLVVPELGAFVVKESGEIIFSELLRKDDGVLTELLLAEGLSQIEVAAVIDRYKFEIGHNIREYGYFKLDELGTICRDTESDQLKLYQLQSPTAPTTSTEVESVAAEEAAEEETAEQAADTIAPETPKEPITTAPKRPRPRRRGVDTILVVAIVVLLMAIAAIGYGYYVSQQMTNLDNTEFIEENN